MTAPWSTPTAAARILPGRDAGARTPIGDHPGGEPPDHQEAWSGQNEQLFAQGDAEPHRHGADEGTEQCAGAPRPVESRHQDAAREPFDGDGLGIHRHVEHPLEEAPEQEGDEERRQRPGEPYERSCNAVADESHTHHAPAAHHRQETGGDHHGQYRTDGSPEQGKAEPAVAQVEVLFQLGDVGRPGGEQESVDEEDSDDCQPWPAVHRPRVGVGVGVGGVVRSSAGVGASVTRSARPLPPSSGRRPPLGRLRHR